MKFQSQLGRFVRNISPATWPLIFGICFLLLGATIPFAALLLKLGIFVIAVYVVIWVIWIIFQANSW